MVSMRKLPLNRKLFTESLSTRIPVLSRRYCPLGLFTRPCRMAAARSASSRPSPGAYARESFSSNGTTTFPLRPFRNLWTSTSMRIAPSILFDNTRNSWNKGGKICRSTVRISTEPRKGQELFFFYRDCRGNAILSRGDAIFSWGNAISSRSLAIISRSLAKWPRSLAIISRSLAKWPRSLAKWSRSLAIEKKTDVPPGAPYISYWPGENKVKYIRL